MRLRFTPLSRLAPLLVACLCSCATQPEQGGGGENLPNAGAGPFRLLAQSELTNTRAAPNVLEDSNAFARDAAVIDLDGDPSTLEVAGYFAAAVAEKDTKSTEADPTNAILRYGALDGRSFDRAAEVVLSPEEPWEGGILAAPAIVREGSELFLYYGGKGGIGLARSSDGHAFTRVSGPVLAPTQGGWENGSAPSSPGVVRLEDGSFRMFYESAIGSGVSAIGEATSPDGVVWTRKGSTPALAPWDVMSGAETTASVGSPFPFPAVTAEGRGLLRLYYGAVDSAGRGVVGLAARFDEEDAFVGATAPVFGSGASLAPREPCVVAFEDFTLLYATEKAKRTVEAPAVAAGVTPATAKLPPPNPQ